MPKLKKRLITARQKSARRINIRIARAAKKRKGKKLKKTRFGNPEAGESKDIKVFIETKRK